jgi:hypothetical protein
MATLRRRWRPAMPLVFGLAFGLTAALMLSACSATQAAPRTTGSTTSTAGGLSTSTAGGATTNTTAGHGAGTAPDERQIVSGLFSSPTDRTDASGTVWLCRPGLVGNPCAGNLTVSSQPASGSPTTLPANAGTGLGQKKADCYYVYPTISPEPTTSADLTVQPAEIFAARQQAAQFSRLCNLWAPMYRQMTLHGLFHGTDRAAALQLAVRSATSAFEDYLHHVNHGRPVVLIGHSQGAAMLIRILQATMDRNPAERRLLVSALIIGANVQVQAGKTVGGSFQHIPLCTSAQQTGCVIAYSSFLHTPPANAFFGAPGTGVSFLSDQRTSAGQQVACTNPAALGSRSPARLDPTFFEGAGTQTPYVALPDRYTAQCRSQRGITWLQVTPSGLPGDTRPILGENLGPTWGLHAYDVNLGLGSLLEDVSQELASFHA